MIFLQIVWIHGIVCKENPYMTHDLEVCLYYYMTI